MELLQIPLQLEFMLKMCLLQLLELVLLQVVETNATAMLGLVKMLLGNDDDDATAVVMQLLLLLDILLLLPQLVLDDAIDHDLAKLADAYVVLQEVLATDVLIAIGDDQAVTVELE